MDQKGLRGKGFLKSKLGCEGLCDQINKHLRTRFCICEGN